MFCKKDKRTSLCEFFHEYTDTFALSPYDWGGQNGQGIDCSGLVVEGLKAVGLIRSNEDYTAQGLYKKCFTYPRHKVFSEQTNFKDKIVLAFYGSSYSKIHHVAIVKEQIAQHGFQMTIILDASGEGSKRVEGSQGGFVKFRPVRYRSQLLGFGSWFNDDNKTKDL